MHFETSTTINAAPERVWAVLTDVVHWPDWTPTVLSVDWVEGDFTTGGVARIKQPGMPTLDWTITEIAPGGSFTWTSRSAGVTTVATHRLVPTDVGVAVTLGIEHSGALAGMVGRLTGRRTQRYITTEAAGLKQRCEAAPA
jgi:uncharacterized protein YndB with AHSA1/START domain